MISKSNEHQRAIELRKDGKSYSEILAQIRVSQSSLSLWLRDIVLTKEQISALNLKKREGQRKGGMMKKGSRLLQEKRILETASAEIKKLSKEELWLIGTIAYWCEGSKQKDWNVSQGVIFSNSDPFLIKLFVKWLKECCLIKSVDIKYNLYIHEQGNVSIALDYWCKQLMIDFDSFGKTSIKKHNILTRRKNIGENYYGLVRVSVRKSTNLNRKIKGWIRGIDSLI